MLGRKFLPEAIVAQSAFNDDGTILSYFRASPDRLYLRDAATGRTIFHLASLNTKPNLLKELLQNVLNETHHYSLHDVDYDGSHALHLCAKLGHLEHLESIVRFCIKPSGMLSFPWPLLDHSGRSVASYCKIPVDWMSTFGVNAAEALLRPRPNIAPNDFTIDDIVAVITLKRSFASTPLPWKRVPRKAHSAADYYSSQQSQMNVEIIRFPAPPTTGQGGAGGGGGQAKVLSGDVTPLEGSMTPGGLGSTGTWGQSVTSAARPSSRQQQLAQSLRAMGATNATSTMFQNLSEPVGLFVPDVSQTSVDTPTLPLLSSTPRESTITSHTQISRRGTVIPAAPATEGLGCFVVQQPQPQKAAPSSSFSTANKKGSMSSNSNNNANNGFQVHVAEMICIKGEIQFDSEIFFHEAETSGAVTLKGTSLYVSNYRASCDPDVLLSCWTNPHFPDVALFLCRRAPRPNLPSHNNNKKRGATMKAKVDVLEATIALYERHKQPPPGRSLEASIARGIVSVSPASPEALKAPDAPPTPGFYDEGNNVDGRNNDSSEEGNEDAKSDEREKSTSRLSVHDYSVAEATNIIRHFLKQRAWGILRETVCTAIKQVNVVKRFVRRIVSLRQKVVNMSFAKAMMVIERTKATLERRRIPINNEGDVLCINIPSQMVHTCCRKSVHRKERQWVVSLVEVFQKIAPFIVGSPDLQGVLARMLTDEWLLPSGQAGAASTSAAVTPSSGNLNARGAFGGGGGFRKANHLLDDEGHHHHRVHREVVRCSPHSPIPYLLTNRAELRAMLVKRTTTTTVLPAVK